MCKNCTFRLNYIHRFAFDSILHSMTPSSILCWYKLLIKLFPIVGYNIIKKTEMDQIEKAVKHMNACNLLSMGNEIREVVVVGWNFLAIEAMAWSAWKLVNCTAQAHNKSIIAATISVNLYWANGGDLLSDLVLSKRSFFNFSLLIPVTSIYLMLLLLDAFLLSSLSLYWDSSRTTSTLVFSMPTNETGEQAAGFRS